MQTTPTIYRGLPCAIGSSCSFRSADYQTAATLPWQLLIVGGIETYPGPPIARNLDSWGPAQFVGKISRGNEIHRIFLIHNDIPSTP